MTAQSGDRRSGYVTRRPSDSSAGVIDVNRDRFGGAVRGDHRYSGGSRRYHSNHGYDRYGHNRWNRHHDRRGIYPRPYPYAATYPYRYPYYPRSVYRYPYYGSHYRPIYPWRSGYGYYFGYGRDNYYFGLGYGGTYYPSCGYWPYRHSYVSVYYDAPVIYRYHDVYTYRDVDYVDSTAYNAPTYVPENSGTSYGTTTEPVYDGASTERAVEAGGVSSEIPIEWTYDPPDGVGPPLDWAGVRTPLPGEPSVVDDGLRAFHANDFETARNAFVRAILLDERDAYAKFLYGLASFAQGDYAVAAVSWRRAALADELFVERPPDVRVLYDDAHVFEAQLDELSRVALDRLHDSEVRFALAYLFYATGQPRIASELFRRLADADPADTLARSLADASAQAALKWGPGGAAAGGP